MPYLDIDDKKLGYWKLENKFYKGRFIRQKHIMKFLEKNIL